MAIITPPRPPPVLTKTGGRSNEAYLIYKGRVPYTCRVNDKTTLVVFNQRSYANFVRVFLESHFLQYKVWPSILQENTFFQFTEHYEDYGLLDIEYINPYYISDLCLSLNVNACVVTDITDNDKITIHCDIIEVEPRPETYRYFLENIYDLGT